MMGFIMMMIIMTVSIKIEIIECPDVFIGIEE